MTLVANGLWTLLNVPSAVLKTIWNTSSGTVLSWPTPVLQSQNSVLSGWLSLALLGSVAYVMLGIPPHINQAWPASQRGLALIILISAGVCRGFDGGGGSPAGATSCAQLQQFWKRQGLLVRLVGECIDHAEEVVEGSRMHVPAFVALSARCSWHSSSTWSSRTA